SAERLGRAARLPAASDRRRDPLPRRGAREPRLVVPDPARRRAVAALLAGAPLRRALRAVGGPAGLRVGGRPAGGRGRVGGAVLGRAALRRRRRRRAGALREPAPPDPAPRPRRPGGAPRPVLRVSAGSRTAPSGAPGAPGRGSAAAVLLTHGYD